MRRVQSLKQLASSMLPAVQQHQALATQTAGAVGADVTATTSQAQKGGSRSGAAHRPRRQSQKQGGARGTDH